MGQGTQPAPGAAGENQFAAALTYLSSVWGMFSFGLSLGPIVMMLLYTQVNAMLQPVVSLRVGGPISLLCTLVISFYMFSLRDDLRRYSLTLPFGKKGSMPLPIWALIFFVTAIFLSFFLAFGVTSGNSLIASPGQFVPGALVYNSFEHMLVKMLLTGVLIFLFVFLALSAGLMAAYTYGKTLPTGGADAPIYADEERLQEQVLASATEQLGLAEQPDVSEMRRLPGGGIALTMNYLGEPIEMDDRQVREERTWEVKADHLGRLIEVDEKDARQVRVEAFQVEPVLASVRKTLGLTGPLQVVSMRRSPDGEVTLVVEQGDRAWTVVADRWNRVISLKERS